LGGEGRLRRRRRRKVILEGRGRPVLGGGGRPFLGGQEVILGRKVGIVTTKMVLSWDRNGSFGRRGRSFLGGGGGRLVLEEEEECQS